MTPTCLRPLVRHDGFSLLEVIFAMVILSFAILGVMGTFRWAEVGVRTAVQGTEALALAQSRLEAKRATRWNQLLVDDLDGNGTSELMMRDDGEGADEARQDGIYTSEESRPGIRVTWTIRAEPPGPVVDAGLVVIEVQASYQIGPGRWKHVRLTTLRGNPGFLGATG